MSYSAFQGWGAGSHTELDPQPRSPGILYNVVEAASGAKYDDGFGFTELQYDFLTRDEYDAINTIFGVTTARSAKITAMIRAQEDDTDASDFIEVWAWVEKPQPNYRSGFHRDLVYKLTYIRVTS
jgi:hypothetical protein